eukprot:1101903_1
MEDSSDEDDDDDDDDGMCKRHVLALYKGKKKKAMISNCIEVISLIWPDIDKDTDILHTIATSSIQAIHYKHDKDNIYVYWDAPLKITVFGTIAYNIHLNKQKRDIRVDKPPFIIPSSDIPLSMQITATVSTKTSTYESNSTQIIVIDYPNAQHPPTPKSEPLVKHTESDPSGPLMDTKPIIFDYQPSYSSGIYGSYVVTPALIPDTHLGKSKSLAIAKRTASDTSEPPIDTTLNMTNVECTTQDPLNPTQHLGKSKSLVIVKRTASDRKSFEYKPSYSSGIYGSYVVTRALLHSTMYRASLSSGVYGSYLFSCHA